MAPRILDRGTGTKRRPVDAFLKVLIRWHHGLEGKGKLRWSVALEMGETLLRFLDAGNVADRNPPQRRIGSREFLEPVLALAQELGMSRAIDIMLERFDRFPNGQVDEDSIVVIGAHVGGIA